MVTNIAKIKYELLVQLNMNSIMPKLKENFQNLNKNGHI